MSKIYIDENLNSQKKCSWSVSCYQFLVKFEIQRWTWLSDPQFAKEVIDKGKVTWSDVTTRFCLLLERYNFELFRVDDTPPPGYCDILSDLNYPDIEKGYPDISNNSGCPGQVSFTSELLGSLDILT